MKRKFLEKAVAMSIILSGIGICFNTNTVFAGDKFGGESSTADAIVENKEITINNGETYNNVYGGYSVAMDDWGDDIDLTKSNHADSNKVIVNGGSMDMVAGGYSNYTSDNAVVMNNGTVSNNIYGGYSAVKNNDKAGEHILENNTVNILGGSVTSNVYGLYVTSKQKDRNKNTLESNIVTIGGKENDNTISIEGNIYGANSADENSTLTKNQVIINSGNIISDTSSEGGIYGAYGSSSKSTVSENTVTITGGIIKADIYGAAANTGYTGIVNNNKVIITGGEIIGNVYAANSQQGKGMHNNGIYIIGNANLSEAVLAGYRSEGFLEKSNIYLESNDFNGNVKKIENFFTVQINSSDITIGNINLQRQDDSGDATGDISVVNSILNVKEETKNIDQLNFNSSKVEINKLSNFNTINIENQNDKTKTVSLGEVKGNGYSTITTDSKFTADSLKDIETINVNMTYLPWEKDGVVIDVAGKADLTDTGLNVNGTLAAKAGTKLHNGDKMSILKAGELTGLDISKLQDTTIKTGFAKESDVSLKQNEDGNSIDFVITSDERASGQVEIISDSRAAATAFVNQGSDILNYAFNQLDDGKYGIKTFAAVYGNRSRYAAANDLKINGWSILAGAGDSKKVNNGDFSWGVFFENGSANYRTYNDFDGAALRGFGNAVYNGGGAMARYKSNNGTYGEFGLRAGTLKNGLNNAVIDGFGQIGGYDIDTVYYGVHAGIGHLFELDADNNIDIYGKYFHVYNEGKTFEILGDAVNFGSMNSDRLRLGARYNQNIKVEVSNYFGLALDYEFNGDVDMTTAGMNTGKSSLKGSTGVFEAGVHYAPNNSQWSIDLGLQGYTGKREGFSGNLQVNYDF